MTVKSLEDLVRGSKSITALLYNQQTGPNVYPGVPPEYTNWRDEVRAWQETCVLFNQSYHMVELVVEGRDASKLLSNLAYNSFNGFTVGKAKQFAPCSYDGYVIGDVILFYVAENQFVMVGRAPAINWVEYHAATGGYDVRTERDERTAARKDPSRRRSYRFQVQGPNAMKVIAKATGRPVPEVKFFNMTKLSIGGRTMWALRHGMAGQPGLELFGPWDEGEDVRQALIEAGKDFGMRLVGGRAYSSNTVESGWIPSPLPAVYTGTSMKKYREWLPAAGYEAKTSIGGSFYSDRIEDYYFTPWDLGYGHIVKFDHDFIGREALERMAGKTHRKKVTLALNDEDVLRVIGTAFKEPGKRNKFVEFPSAVYSMHPYDVVLVKGKPAGVSTWISYSANEGKMLTLAVLDAAHSTPGTEITLVWGEPGGGSAKPLVERHVQTEIRGIVCPVPYSQVARTDYAEGWRTKAKAS
ncbi:MAG TPA: aminomethyl transferase family protein [Xanthobacteraceae bacterium]|jgi:syringate O-demethylase